MRVVLGNTSNQWRNSFGQVIAVITAVSEQDITDTLSLGRRFRDRLAIVPGDKHVDGRANFLCGGNAAQRRCV